MTRLCFTLFILLLAILACVSSPPFVIPASTATHAPELSVTVVTPSATPPPLVTAAVVIVRLTVRESPCVEPDNKAAYLEVGTDVQLTGQTDTCDDGGRWVQLLGGGWVNSRYLEEE